MTTYTGMCTCAAGCARNLMADPGVFGDDRQMPVLRRARLPMLRRRDTAARPGPARPGVQVPGQLLGYLLGYFTDRPEGVTGDDG